MSIFSFHDSAQFHTPADRLTTGWLTDCRRSSPKVRSCPPPPLLLPPSRGLLVVVLFYIFTIILRALIPLELHRRDFRMLPQFYYSIIWFDYCFHFFFVCCLHIFGLFRRSSWFLLLLYQRALAWSRWVLLNHRVGVPLTDRPAGPTDKFQYQLRRMTGLSQLVTVWELFWGWHGWMQ